MASGVKALGVVSLVGIVWVFVTKDIVALATVALVVVLSVAQVLISVILFFVALGSVDLVFVESFVGSSVIVVLSVLFISLLASRVCLVSLLLSLRL